ncbi:hypothetical protein AtNW77_Chr2g0241041 [Arabidopsis thaliana]|uniref:Uncharacterized protein n=3 Tax=Arabidopsis TaxID=3701 RepID=A0A178VZI6_ARATH|nr:hypothetical protein ISN45_At02g016410 [Arabidopsis thaliana x Arabidopsis arenosa]KAG7641689.1 hypothetical protein ISN44_As02g016860 [Arabidopsis suecica]OAP10252.1 hypothetical protein AXX17_AT2G18120 [Arabidopsis thaliana]
MSIIMLTHRYLVREVHAVPFLTKHGIGFYFFSRNSVLHVHQKVHLFVLKRFCYPQKFPFKPSKPSQIKADVQETLLKPSKPSQSKADVQETLLKPSKPSQSKADVQETLLKSSKPSQSKADVQETLLKPSKLSQSKAKVQEKSAKATSTIKTLQIQERELFSGSVTMDAAPSPRHVRIPIFCYRE